MASLSPKNLIPIEPKLLARKSAEFAKKTLAKTWKVDDKSSASPPLQRLRPDQADSGFPGALLNGTTMIKVSKKEQKKKVFQLDPDEGRILYKKSGKIGIGMYLPPIRHSLIRMF